MMRKILITLLILTMLTGCEKTYCPGFPDHLINYFPYSEGDTIRFTNTNSDTLTFEITHSWSSDSYSYKWNEKCACEAGVVFRTELNEKYNLMLEGSILLYPDPRSVLVLYFYNNDFLSSIIENIDPFKKENEAIFGDTLTLENDYSGEQRISKIMIVKGKGIVYFVDEQEDCKWGLIEE